MAAMTCCGDGLFQAMEVVMHRLIIIAYMSMLPQNTGVSHLVFEVTVGFAQFFEVVAEMATAATAFHLPMKVLRGTGQAVAVNALVGVAPSTMDLLVQMLGGIGKAVRGGCNIRRMSRRGRAADRQCCQYGEYVMETHDYPPAIRSRYTPTFRGCLQASTATLNRY